MTTILDTPSEAIGLEEPSIGSLPTPDLDTKKTVAIHLVNESAMPNCSFWVGLFQRGAMQPPEVLDAGDFSAIFQKAATEGLKEAGPIMLSDSMSSPARYIYLLPEPSSDELESDRMIPELVKTVQAWAPKKTGIYLAPELLTRQANHDLLFKILEKLISTVNTTDYYLVPGLHGMNAVLNTALEIKALCQSDDCGIYVFH